jgi:hypothetical protein
MRSRFTFALLLQQRLIKVSSEIEMGLGDWDLPASHAPPPPVLRWSREADGREKSIEIRDDPGQGLGRPRKLVIALGLLK